MQGSRPCCPLLGCVQKEGSVGINPKDSSHALPQCPPWGKGACIGKWTLKSDLWVPSQVCKWLLEWFWSHLWGPVCDSEHGFRGIAPNMAFSSWGHLQWKFCFVCLFLICSPLLLNKGTALTCMWCGRVHSACPWRLPKMDVTNLKLHRKNLCVQRFIIGLIPLCFISSQY